MAPLSAHWLGPKVQSLPSFLTTPKSQINQKFFQLHLQDILNPSAHQHPPSTQPLCLTWTAILPTCSHSFLSFSKAEHPSHSGCSHVTWCKKWTFFAPVLLKHQYQVPKQVSGKSSQAVFQKKSSVTFSSYLESLSPILNKKESDKKRI